MSHRPEVRQFLLKNVTQHPKDLVSFAAQHFGISRQAIFNATRQLLEAQQILVTGKNRGTAYSLPTVHVVREVQPEANGEDVVWRELAAPVVEFLPENVRTIAYHGFTEMFNNGGPDQLDFSKTTIAVKRLESGADPLISRSQAKRLLQRLSRFEEVVLDFADVETVGPAFADEIFRVFAARHTDVTLTPLNMTTNVEAMVSRAQRALRAQMIHGPQLFEDV